MAKNGFKILDSDMHIMEPPDLWERYIDKNYQDRAPRGITSTNVRDLRMAHPDGREWGNQTTEENRDKVRSTVGLAWRDGRTARTWPTTRPIGPAGSSI